MIGESVLTVSWLQGLVSHIFFPVLLTFANKTSVITILQNKFSVEVICQPLVPEKTNMTQIYLQCTERHWCHKVLYYLKKKKKVQNSITYNRRLCSLRCLRSFRVPLRLISLYIHFSKDSIVKFRYQILKLLCPGYANLITSL